MADTAVYTGVASGTARRVVLPRALTSINAGWKCTAVDPEWDLMSCRQQLGVGNLQLMLQSEKYGNGAVNVRKLVVMSAILDDTWEMQYTVVNGVASGTFKKWYFYDGDRVISSMPLASYAAEAEPVMTHAPDPQVPLKQWQFFACIHSSMCWFMSHTPRWPQEIMPPRFS